MADEKVLYVSGKPLNDLRVVDLKKELDKRNLSKSGSKKDLYERLKTQLQLEKLREQSVQEEDQAPTIQVPSDGQNEFVKQYLAQREKLFQEQKEQKKKVEEEEQLKRASQSESEAESESNQMTSPKSAPPKSPVKSPVKDIEQQKETKKPPMSPAVEKVEEAKTPEKSPSARPKRGWRRGSLGRTEQTASEPPVLEPVVQKEPEEMPAVKTITQSSPQKQKPTVEPEPTPQPETKEEPPTLVQEKALHQKQPLQDSTPTSKKAEEDVPPELEDMKREKSPVKKDAETVRKSVESPKKEAEASKQKASPIKQQVEEHDDRRVIVGESESSNEEKPVDKRVVESSDGKGDARKVVREKEDRRVVKADNESDVSPEEVKKPEKEDPVKEIAKPVKRKGRSKSSSSSSSSDDSSSSEQDQKAKKRESSSSSRSRSPSASSKSEADSASSQDSEEETIKRRPTTRGEIQKHSPQKSPQKSPEKKKEDVAPTLQSAEKNEKNLAATSDLMETDQDTQKEPPKLEAQVVQKTGDIGSSLKDKPARKRKWGSTRSTAAKKSSISISTDSLKGLIPDIKASALNAEPVLELTTAAMETNMDEKDSESEEEEERKEVVQIRRTVVQDVKEETNGEVAEEPTAPMESEKIEAPARKIVSRKESVIPADEPQAARRTPSPPRNPPSSILHVRHLVRPFTVGQLKELLGRTGTLKEDGFWIDKIKSHCLASYESVEGASETRQALHGTRWPSSNPKILRVDFATEDDLAHYKGGNVAPVKEVVEKKEATPPKKRERRESERGERGMREVKVKDKVPEKPVREWDKHKLRQSESRSRSRERERPKERKDPQERHRSDEAVKPRSRSRERRRRERERERSREQRHDRASEKKEEDEPPAKLLDDLFRKTKATPCVYWLPLTEEQLEARIQDKKRREEEREKRRLEREQEMEAERKQREKEREKRTEARSRPARRSSPSGSRSRSRSRRRP